MAFPIAPLAIKIKPKDEYLGNLKEDKILNINACLTSSDLNDTGLNIFPEIEQVLIDI